MKIKRAGTTKTVYPAMLDSDLDGKADDSDKLDGKHASELGGGLLVKGVNLDESDITVSSSGWTNTSNINTINPDNYATTGSVNSYVKYDLGSQKKVACAGVKWWVDIETDGKHNYGSDNVVIPIGASVRYIRVITVSISGGGGIRLQVSNDDFSTVYNYLGRTISTGAGVLNEARLYKFIVLVK